MRPGERRDAGFHEIIRTSDSNTCAVMPRRSRRPKLIKEAPGFISFGRISHRTFQHPERACRTCHRTLTSPEFPPERAREPLAVHAAAVEPAEQAPVGLDQPAAAEPTLPRAGALPTGVAEPGIPCARAVTPARRWRTRGIPHAFPLPCSSCGTSYMKHRTRCRM